MATQSYEELRIKKLEENKGKLEELRRRRLPPSLQESARTPSPLSMATESYEELRRKKLEENEGKLEEIKRHRLSLSLKEPAPKPSPLSMSTESYEELRRKKLEENKRKLEELKIHHLSLCVQESAPKPSQAKKERRKPAPFETVIKRCSDRISQLPQTTYKEPVPEVVQRPRKAAKRRDLSGRVYASDEARSFAFEKAGELQAGLGNDRPSFVKPMLQSHTTGGFWLGLPIHFCNKHLPKSDSTIVLEDKEGNASDTVYLAQKRGLSGGWRGFSISHGLVDGDALVFQLIKKTTFKVYIIRASGYNVN